MGLCLAVMCNSKYSWYQDRLVLLALSRKDWVELYALPLRGYVQHKCQGGNSWHRHEWEESKEPQGCQFFCNEDSSTPHNMHVCETRVIKNQQLSCIQLWIPSLQLKEKCSLQAFFQECVASWWSFEWMSKFMGLIPARLMGSGIWNPKSRGISGSQCPWGVGLIILGGRDAQGF